jgi:hypothetical protein
MAACFSVPSAYSAGNSFFPAGSWWSIGTGVAGVGVVAAAATLLSRALKSFKRRKWFAGGVVFVGWAIAFGTTLAVSVENFSSVNGDVVEAKTNAIGRFERATGDPVRLNTDRGAAGTVRCGKRRRPVRQSITGPDRSVITLLAFIAKSRTQHQSSMPVALVSPMDSHRH